MLSGADLVQATKLARMDPESGHSTGSVRRSIMCAKSSVLNHSLDARHVPFLRLIRTTRTIILPFKNLDPQRTKIFSSYTSRRFISALTLGCWSGEPARALIDRFRPERTDTGCSRVFVRESAERIQHQIPCHRAPVRLESRAFEAARR